jgi:hypothetical protein
MKIIENPCKLAVYRGFCFRKEGKKECFSADKRWLFGGNFHREFLQDVIKIPYLWFSVINN